MRVLTLVHFGLFSLWFLAMIAGTFLERWILAKQDPRYGFILPALNFVLAVGVSVPNFITAWRIYLSMPAFVAAVVIFVFLNLPTILFTLMTLQALDDQRQREARRRAARPIRRTFPNGAPKKTPPRNRTTQNRRPRQSQTRFNNDRKKTW